MHCTGGDAGVGHSIREGLSEWVHAQGFPQPRWGAHFSGRAQERLLNAAANHDARVSALETAYVQVTLQACEQGVREPDQTPLQRRTTDAPALPAQSWEALDLINLAEVFQDPIPSVAVLPIPVPGRYRHAARTALQERHDAAMVGDVQRETRAWKLFTLLPFMLLRRVPGQSHVSKDELHARFNKFGDGQWVELLDEAHRSTTVFVPRSPSVDSAERGAEAAERKVMLGEVSRARQCLTGAALAPGTEERFQTMQNRRPQVATRPISQEAREFRPEVPVSIDRKVFLQCLKSALRGSSPGPGGCTYEHLKMLLDEMDTVELLALTR